MMSHGTRVRGQRFSSLDYAPAPVAVLRCGPYNDPDIGCNDCQDDAIAACTQALVYAHAGDHRYADSAIAIMNAWSGTLTAIDRALIRDVTSACKAGLFMEWQTPTHAGD